MKDRTVDRDKILTVLQDEFSAGREVALTVTGSSMEPLLRHLRDQVILMPPEKYVPKTGDIIFFRREDGACVCIVSSDERQKADTLSTVMHRHGRSASEKTRYLQLWRRW